MKKLLLIPLFAFVACKKDDPLPPEEVGTYESGMIILNEGLFQQNNATLSFYSFQDNMHHSSVFFQENNRGLGDTANDMDVYTVGDTTYLIIAVDVSSQIEIVNTTTLKSVAQIPVFDGANPRQPRKIIVEGSKAFSCNYDGTVSVVDLLTNTIESTIPVGSNPDGITSDGTFIYTCNSGGLNFPVYDSTISVIDLQAQSYIGEIPSLINCTEIIADNDSDLYVMSNGNYNDIDPAILVMNPYSGVAEDTLDRAVTSWTFYNDLIYFYDQDEQGVFTLNTLTEVISWNALIDCSAYSTMYGVHVNPHGIFTVDANGYVNASTIRCYDFQGNFQYSFDADLNSADIYIQ